jgi:hypothetical protein
VTRFLKANTASVRGGSCDKGNTKKLWFLVIILISSAIVNEWVHKIQLQKNVNLFGYVWVRIKIMFT